MKFNKISGSRPVSKNIPVNLINIDQSYQRDANEAKINRIAKNWNWDTYKAGTVAARNIT